MKTSIYASYRFLKITCILTVQCMQIILLFCFFSEISENYHHAAQPEWQEKHPCMVSWHLFIFHPQDKQFPSWQWHFSMSEYQRYFAASLHFTCLFVESATVAVFVNVKAK